MSPELTPVSYEVTERCFIRGNELPPRSVIEITGPDSLGGCNLTFEKGSTHSFTAVVGRDEINRAIEAGLLAEVK